MPLCESRLWLAAMQVTWFLDAQAASGLGIARHAAAACACSIAPLPQALFKVRGKPAAALQLQAPEQAMKYSLIINQGAVTKVKTKGISDSQASTLQPDT